MKRLTVPKALDALSGSDSTFKKLFEHGSLEVEIYKPDQVDLQQPHARDEIYVIATGRGKFRIGNAEHPVEVGEVLFVPAGVEHRFFDFTNDFSTWVFFFGPEGGESNSE